MRGQGLIGPEGAARIAEAFPSRLEATSLGARGVQFDGVMLVVSALVGLFAVMFFEYDPKVVLFAAGLAFAFLATAALVAFVPALCTRIR